MEDTFLLDNMALKLSTEIRRTYFMHYDHICPQVIIQSDKNGQLTFIARVVDNFYAIKTFTKRILHLIVLCYAMLCYVQVRAFE